MSSTEARVSRMPEIENIALSEALKDFGFERVLPGDDIVVHVGRGPKGLFVSSAEKPRVGSGHEAAEKIEPAKTAGRRPGADLVAASTNSAASGYSLCGNADQTGDLVQETLIKAWSRRAPDEAVNFGVDALTRAANSMASIVEETRSDLVEIEMQRKQIDRTQARTREILNELLGQAQ